MENCSHTPADIEASLQRKSWWAVVFILPAARRVSLFVVNRTALTPNAITIGSFLFVIAAALCYVRGDYAAAVWGAIFFEVNYLFDCVDGTVARVKKMGTPLGAYLDPKLDRLRIVILSLALAYGEWRAGAGLAAVLALMGYLGVNNLLLLTRAAQERVLAAHNFPTRLGADLVSGTSTGLLARWLRAARERNLMPYYHDVELDALVFVVGPLLQCVLPCTLIAIALGLILILLLDLLFVRSLRRATKGALP